MSYVEQASDFAFSAFLAGLTPTRVLRERERALTPAERKHLRYLRERARLDALVVAGRLQQWQLDIALDVVGRSS